MVLHLGGCGPCRGRVVLALMVGVGGDRHRRVGGRGGVGGSRGRGGVGLWQLVCGAVVAGGGFVVG